MPDLTSKLGLGHSHILEEHGEWLVSAGLLGQLEHFVHVERLHLLNGGVGRGHALDFEEAASCLALKGGDAPHGSGVAQFVRGHVRQTGGEPLVIYLRLSCAGCGHDV